MTRAVADSCECFMETSTSFFMSIRSAHKYSLMLNFGSYRPIADGDPFADESLAAKHLCDKSCDKKLRRKILKINFLTQF